MDYISFKCGECDDFITENHDLMVKHVLDMHPHYTPEEADNFATIWEEDARDEFEAEQVYRTQEYERTGIDPMDIPSDRDDS
jgi:hypothetical protein